MKTYDKKTYDSKFLADGPIRIHPHTYYQGHGVDIVNQLNRLLMSIGKMETEVTYDHDEAVALTPKQLGAIVDSLTDGMKFKVVFSNSEGSTYTYGYSVGSKNTEYYNIRLGTESDYNNLGYDGHVVVPYDGSEAFFEGGPGEGYTLSSITIGKDTPVYKLDDSALTALEEALKKKVDKVSGKRLSTNDYTTAEKTKLAGIEEGANKTTTDTSLSSTSENPIANKAVKSALDNKVDKENGTATSLTVNTALTVKSGDTSVSIAPASDGAASASGTDGGTLLFPYIGQGVSETVALLSDLPTKVSDLANDSGFLTADDLTQLKLGTLSLGSTSTAVAAQKADIVKFVQNFGTSMTYHSEGTEYTVTGVSAYATGGRFVVYISTGTDSSGSATQSVCYAAAAANAPTFTLIDADGNYADDSYNYLLSALLRA